jgi:PKHD-type hydroxylase
MIYPIPPRHSLNKSTHAFWENFLTVEEIDKILSMPEWFNHTKAFIGGSQNKEINKNIRRSDVAWVDVNQNSVWLWEKLTRVVADVNCQFFKFNLSGCYEPIQLGIYKESDQGHYDWHTDSSLIDCNAPRKLSMSLLLSDPSEFEGGELQIKTNNDEIHTLGCVKGRAWFFPSYTLHRVTPITKGVRRSLVLWVGGPEFK